MSQMQEIAKEVIFAMCPKCLWLATYLKEIEENCPICDAKVTRFRVAIE